jgi:hypothetical protein
MIYRGGSSFLAVVWTGDTQEDRDEETMNLLTVGGVEQYHTTARKLGPL